MIDIKFSGTIKEVCMSICEWADVFRMATTLMGEDESSVPAPFRAGAQPKCETPSPSPRKRGRPAAKVDSELPVELSPAITEEPTFAVTEEPVVPTFSFDDIRAATMQIMERHGPSERDKALGTEDVKEWLRTAGVTRLRELQEENYAPLMAYAQKKGWLK